MSFDVPKFFKRVVQYDKIKMLSSMKKYELFHAPQAIDKYQEWYRLYADTQGFMNVLRFSVAVRDFCGWSESRITSMFNLFDFFKRGALDATDLYLLLALMLGQELKLRVIFLYQHQTNILPYIQFKSGNSVIVSELFDLLRCSNVSSRTINIALKGMGHQILSDATDLSTASNFLFACYYIQDIANSNGQKIYSKFS